MATLQVTARRKQQSLNGQGVRIYLNGTETLSKLPFIAVGDRVGIVSSGFQGHVASVDSFGSSFLAIPDSEVKNLSSTTTPGYIAVNELVNIN